MFHNLFRHLFVREVPIFVRRVGVQLMRVYVVYAMVLLGIAVLVLVRGIAAGFSV